MNEIGFSTGAIAMSDFRSALRILEEFETAAVELSALRFHELPPLAEAAFALDLNRYVHVSFHAPSDFAAADERHVTGILLRIAERGWPVVVHPDAIVDWSLWTPFGDRLLVENMDPRRSLGRGVAELIRVFDRLPDARLCFDIAHARQVDTSMLEAFLVLERFSDRLGQVHVSELDAFCRHRRLSRGGIAALREVSSLIPHHVPAIIEAPVEPSEIESEIAASLEALGRPVPLAYAA